MLLAQFRFSIAYKEGQENGLADTLSRFPMDDVAFIFAGISTNNGEEYGMDEIWLMECIDDLGENATIDQ